MATALNLVTNMAKPSSNYVNSVRFARGSDYVALTDAANYVELYPISTAGALSTALSSFQPSAGNIINRHCVSCHPGADQVIVGVGGAIDDLYIYTYTSTGLTYQNAINVGLEIQSLDIAPSGSFVAVGDSTGTICVLNYSASDYSGASAGTLATGLGVLWNVTWSPDSQFIAVVGSLSPYFNVYKWNGDGTFGGPFAPSTAPIASGVGLHWHPAGDYIAEGGSSHLSIYKWDAASTSFGAKIASSTGVTNTVWDLRWSKDGAYLLSVLPSTILPILIYEWSSSALGDLCTYDVVPSEPNFTGDISIDNRHMVIGNHDAPYSVISYTGFDRQPIEGTVTLSGNAVNGATVAAVRQGSGLSYEVTSSTDGTYSMVVPRDGTYDVYGRYTFGSRQYTCIKPGVIVPS